MKIKQTQKKASTIIQSQKGEEKQETSLVATTTEKDFRNTPYNIANNFLQLAISSEDMQSTITYDDQGNPQIIDGSVKFNYTKDGKRPRKDKTSAEIIIKNAFLSEADNLKKKEEELEKLQQENNLTDEQIRKKQELEQELTQLKNIQDNLYKPISQVRTGGNGKLTKYNLLTKKVELYSVEKLYNSDTSTITISDKEFADIFKIDKSNINRDISVIATALTNLQFRQFSWKRSYYAKINGVKQIVPGISGVVNVYQDIMPANGETTFTFNDKIAYLLKTTGTLQLPSEIYSVRNKLAFDLILYFYSQAREKKSSHFKIKASTLYENIKQIPRYEDIKANQYRLKIYEPLEDALKLLSTKPYTHRYQKGSKKTGTAKEGKIKVEGLNIIDAHYENKKFDEPCFNFNQWLDTNIEVHILKEAKQIQRLKDKQEHYKKLTEKKNK